MGNASNPDLAAVATAIVVWLTQDASIAHMEQRFSFFKSSDGSKEFEAGGGVDYAWNKMDGWVAQDLPRLTPLVEAAKRRPQLRQLLPFTSHESLHFSRSMGYPYTSDIGHAIPLRDGQYQALGPGYTVIQKIYKNEATGKDFEYAEADHDILGEGNADYVIDLIVAALPADCGPAITGTAKDLMPKTSFTESEQPQCVGQTMPKKPLRKARPCRLSRAAIR